MLAKKRTIKFRNGQRLETPILLPSFSSKTFQDEDVAKIIDFSAAAITEEILVSTYDVCYKKVNPKNLSFSSAVILDSGGYEASEDTDLSDTGKKGHKPRTWTTAQFNSTLKNMWDFNIPTILVSYDSPRSKVSIERQIERARKTFLTYPEANSNFLIKTESVNTPYLDIDEIIKHRHKLSEFDIIGVTEKELGRSALQRMLNIAKLRQALNQIGLDPPIHVFGSLDTVSTPLYFFAGADIFDGLTWLRYAFHQGKTIYKHNYGAMQLGAEFEDYRVNGKVWSDNYFYMLRLKRDMTRFMLNEDFKQFEFNGDLFESIVTQFHAKLKEGV